MIAWSWERTFVVALAVCGVAADLIRRYGRSLRHYRALDIRARGTLLMRVE